MALDPKATELVLARLKHADEANKSWVFVQEDRFGAPTLVSNTTHLRTKSLLERTLQVVTKIGSFRRLARSRPSIQRTCPHGYTLANDCPDCHH